MKYIEADLFKGIVGNYSDKVTIIPHICNNVKKWGAGFVIPLANHFPEARSAFYDVDDPQLGNTVFVQADKVPVVVANMFAQDGVGPTLGVPPIRYDALQKCMDAVRDMAQHSLRECVIACPMFGAGLAGGDWEIISKMIFQTWSEAKIETQVYFLPEFLPKNLRAINVGTNADDMEIRIIPR